MLTQIKDSIDYDVKMAQEKREKYEEYKDEIKHIARFLFEAEVDVQRATMCGSLDISVCGDFTVLKGAFSALRKAGYEPKDRPQAADPTFSTYFSKPDGEFKIWFHYTSTICTRKKIGTKMQEVAIYETVCE
jgi:hypothetical protein